MFPLSFICRVLGAGRPEDRLPLLEEQVTFPIDVKLELEEITVAVLVDCLTPTV